MVPSKINFLKHKVEKSKPIYEKAGSFIIACVTLLLASSLLYKLPVPSEVEINYTELQDKT